VSGNFSQFLLGTSGAIYDPITYSTLVQPSPYIAPASCAMNVQFQLQH
jgi:hypothetical protein